MPRMVIFTDAMSDNGRLIAVNADLVSVAFAAADYQGRPCSRLLIAHDEEAITVFGLLSEVVARLNGDDARAINAVHLTGWVLDPNHPERQYRLHPSILTDDQPPAWAPKPATNGGDQ